MWYTFIREHIDYAVFVLRGLLYNTEWCLWRAQVSRFILPGTISTYYSIVYHLFVLYKVSIYFIFDDLMLRFANITERTYSTIFTPLALASAFGLGRQAPSRILNFPTHADVWFSRHFHTH